MGRKSESQLSKDRGKRFLAEIRKGARPNTAARLAKVPWQQIKRRSERDTQFRDAWATAEARVESEMSSIVMKAAMGEHDGDWRAAMVWLERRFPELWAKPEAQAALKAGPMDALSLVDGLTFAMQLMAAKHARRRVNLKTGKMEDIADADFEIIEAGLEANEIDDAEGDDLVAIDWDTELDGVEEDREEEKLQGGEGSED